MSATRTATQLAALGAGCFVTYALYRADQLQPLPATRLQSDLRRERLRAEERHAKLEEHAADNSQHLAALPFQGTAPTPNNQSAGWGSFSNILSTVSDATSSKLSAVTEQISDLVVPEWVTLIPGYFSKLQQEMSMAPGSLADEIWREARDPDINPEICRPASVRVSEELCAEEQNFLEQRRHVVRAALALYLDIPVQEIHPDDVPCIAMVGSGGGLRALVAGTGSMLAAKESGLFDTVTYTAGVSGSCWLQTLFHSSVGRHDFAKMVDHLKARLGIHIAYPPVALNAINSAPTNKFLLSAFIEKLKGDSGATLGLVDVYGLLLAARLLVPKGEVGVDNRDLKLSNQRYYLQHGEQPMPIYTAVRHEIPIIEESAAIDTQGTSPSEESKEIAKQEAWFQWFEITPYEMFCEELAAGIPTWAIGRKFEGGKDVPCDGLCVPELRVPLFLGTFGSAFCASLQHYYREIKPLIRGLLGFASIDELIEGRNDDLSKVHPIDPIAVPNYAYKMDGLLADTTPESIYKSEYLQLMDAGMSNNLPIYPLLRPGRNVDILIAIDASADIKTENWLSVADGYAKQRGVKGWPIGLGWPKASSTAEANASQLEEASAKTVDEAEVKLEEAKDDQDAHLTDVIESKVVPESTDAADIGDLGYCTVWVGTTEERSTSSDVPVSKAVEDHWQLTHPHAGIAVVYMPFLSNPKVPDVDPTTSDYMSTWNFIYTPEQVDSVIALAQANFSESQEQLKGTVRAVYMRKKQQREAREQVDKEERRRRKVRLGLVGKLGEGDHFHLT